MSLCYSLRQVMKSGYSLALLRKDIVSGMTVGVVAIPLGMALAIAIGVPPQHGLYTVIVAGFLVALFGGSCFNITGPTAAFVVILLPITQQFGLSGLLVATMMSGMWLALMGGLKLGRVIRFVPYPVTIGFTAGIGFVIAFLQLKDLLGLTLTSSPIHFFDKVFSYVNALPSINYADTVIGLLTIVSFIMWSKVCSKVPPHVMALFVATVLAAIINNSSWTMATTIGDKFHYVIDGFFGRGIPQQLPEFSLPWQDIELSWGLIYQLLPASIAIALLGAIESLLCAVVADGMTKTRHDSDSELVAQGLGNMIAPLFGAIPATAAIARTATNIRAGGMSPISAMIHAVFVLIAMLILAPVLAYIPMAGLAGLLIMVAWNMSEAPHFVKLIKTAPRRDVIVLLVCFSLTVAFDMVVAVAVGIALAGVLFIQRVLALTAAHSTVTADIEHESMVYHYLEGPLFFAACDKIKQLVDGTPKSAQVIIFDMEKVTAIDISALNAIQEAMDQLSHARILVCNLSSELWLKVQRIGWGSLPNVTLCESDAQFTHHLSAIRADNRVSVSTPSPLSM